ncbi:helix-turn-helix transcriptional regulator [Devosia ginsengisoli]|uniref:helix-turn-helix transcriptional regulator n=1 Tax=Devosia ginsengisoli TaxID=400770 RepID=UPI0026F313A1|nr:helix-turn-helix transcriptional regulator [Devosia ginsengisoli]MCR6672107.1 helix-turn-helix transcriptional regulator [Devosia ginsengisoli]
MQSSNDNRLLDDIYEAAFVPELWQRAIAEAGRLVEAPTGALMVFDAERPVSFAALEPSFEVTRSLVEANTPEPDWHIRYWQQHPFTGFVVAEDYFPADALARDPHRGMLRRMGFASQMGTIIAMPTGEVVVFHVDRVSDETPFDSTAVERLNVYYPHLARASLLSARLGLERTEVTLSALASVGLPAAAVSPAGVVVSVNAIFDDVKGVFRAAAHGRIALADPAANLLLQAALATANGDSEPLVRSVPVAGTDATEPVMVHVLPLRGAAQDIFHRASAVVIASPVRASNLVPSASILTGLFDLTPAEARLATALARGDTPAGYAEEAGLSMPTVRSHLSRIMAKTGTARQPQLIALLKSAGRLGSL